jgi:NitT/TauT family transport system ATP-binding protein
MEANAPPAKLELVGLKLRYPSPQGEDAAGSDDPGLAVDLVGQGATAPVHIAPAEFTVLLGPSGCGKSSLLRMVAGLVSPTEGYVLKDGRKVGGPGRDRGMVFQSYTSFPWLNVEENVLFGLRLERSHQGESDQRSKVDHLLELVGLRNARSRRPHELSGGMKQRVAIARALAVDPDILLMDEPFGALDPHIRVRMQDLMLAIERQLRMTLLFVTHDAREAAILADTIYISTLRPCFLKYRLEHPFKKAELDRIDARNRYPKDFLRFQREIETRLQCLIENPEEPRVIEDSDRVVFQRSNLGVLEQVSAAYNGGGDIG